MQKSEARAIIRDRLKALDGKLDKSKKICDKFEGLNLRFNSILLYKALDSEVNVDSLIEKYKNNKAVYLPKVIGNDMALIRVDQNTKYGKGAFNILEPIGEELNPKDVQIDICVTPLLGFDEALNRLGKGKGYYDKFFAVNDPIKVGMAFETQRVEDVVFFEFDKKLDMIITEDKIYENN